MIFTNPIFIVIISIAFGVPLLIFFINLIRKKMGKGLLRLPRRGSFRKVKEDPYAQHIRDVVKEYDMKHNLNQEKYRMQEEEERMKQQRKRRKDQET